jgi:hypothetical protein
LSKALIGIAVHLHVDVPPASVSAWKLVGEFLANVFELFSS